MKILLTLFVLLSFTGFSQQIGTIQIKDNAITEPKLAPNALRPVSGGALPSGVLLFDEPNETFTKTITADFALTLNGSSVANSKMTISFTGDGIHVVTWPATWYVVGTYNVNALNKLELTYDGTDVYGRFLVQRDIIEVTLTDAVVNSSTPAQLTLTFDNAVNITTAGWTFKVDGATVPLVAVTGSGTAAPIFNIVRNILAGEVLTISYDPSTGATASLTGNEIETITDQSVTGIPAAPPSTQTCDITVCASGCDYTTVTAASAAATSGQVICVSAGTYRESITAKTGVTYEAKKTSGVYEDAIISGFDVIANSGWTVHTGNIYKKTITLPVNGYNTSTTQTLYPTAIYANQILRNGVMMPEARWPNVTTGTDDYLDRTKYRNGIDYSNGFNTTSVTDATLPVAGNANPALGALVGATLVCNGWFMQETRTITGHSNANVLSWATAIWDNSATGKWSRKRYYIINKLVLLDAAAEWFYDGTTLYFWQPGGGTISGTVEYKARNWGFDARGKTNVTIRGLKFTGCEPFVGDASSTNATIDQINSTFANHYVRHDVNEWQGVGMAKQFGIKLLGANSVIKNSTIAYSAGTTTWLGPTCRFENNLVHDIGYAGYWGNAVSLWDVDGDQVITRNTIYRTGRAGVDFGYHFGVAPGTSKHLNVEVSYNDISQFMMLSQDAGATYAWGQCVLTGLNYHHNWLYNSAAPDRSDVGINSVIYFDQATGPGKIHHNVTWLCSASDMYHEVINETRSPSIGGWGVYGNPAMDIYNNTFANLTGDAAHDNTPAYTRSYVAYRPAPFDKQRNNIYVSTIVASSGNDITNSVLPGTNPQFVATGSGGLYYRPGVSSPAIGIGLATFTGINGPVTDGSTTAGAYIYNDPDPWVPGQVAIVDEATGTINDNNASITYSSGQWTYYPTFKTAFQNGDAHVTLAQGATATYVFTGTQIAVKAEKCDNMGTARFQIFDDTTTDGVFVNQIGSNVDVNLYNNSGGTSTNICPTGVLAEVFNVSGLTAGDKMIKITLQTIDNTATPQRNSLVFDALIVTP